MPGCPSSSVCKTRCLGGVQRLAGVGNVCVPVSLSTAGHPSCSGQSSGGICFRYRAGAWQVPPLVVWSVATLPHLLKCSHFITFLLLLLCVSVLEDWRRRWWLQCCFTLLLVVVSRPPRVSLGSLVLCPIRSSPLRGGGPKLHGQGADLHSATQGTIQEVLGTVASEFLVRSQILFAFSLLCVWSIVPRRYLHSSSGLS